MRYCFVLLFLGVILTSMFPAEGADVHLSCEADNDLYQVLLNSEIACRRYDSCAEALQETVRGDGLLVLADGYPERTTEVPSGFYEQAAAKGVRLFVEYPSRLPGMEVGEARKVGVERAVVTDDFFGEHLGQLRIMSISARSFVPVEAERPHVVFARVAGFDKAVYGLPAQTHALLFEHPKQDLLVATTKLSHFVTGRYAPRDAVEAMWGRILSWVRGDDALPSLRWKATVRYSYGPDEPLPKDVEKAAVARGLQWYINSRLLVEASMEEKIDQSMEAGTGALPAPRPGEPLGDGSLGILQCYLSGIQSDGSQLRNVARRGDNNCETAMTFALGSRFLEEPEYRKIAENVLDFYLFDSDARKGGRADPKHGAFGLIAWGAGDPAWLVANYGEDNARQMMGIMATAAITGQERWDESVAMCMLGNLRTTGVLGFRGDRIDMGALQNGWEPYFHSSRVNMAPHFEAYLWADYLWAYHHTGDELLYERTIKAIRMMMDNYPDGWRWTNGLAQEKVRMLLPLAWLVRVNDTPEHRSWLRQAGEGVIGLQEPCGAIREELGIPGKGMFPPPGSNEAYGGGEASLIQNNGDPVCDLLYTTNFAFLGLHEAAAATGDPFYSKAEEKLAKFLCRIQVRSEAHPELDGAWFRAFDFKRWEHWASDADAGWGAWCAITGWTHSWITSVLAMRQMETDLWDSMSDADNFAVMYKKWRPIMLPADKIKPKRIRQKVDTGIKIDLQTPPDKRFTPATGPNALIDGQLASSNHASGQWLGFHGEDLNAVVDLGQSIKVRTVAIQFLQSTGVGIFVPPRIELSFSFDGVVYGGVVETQNTLDVKTVGPLTHMFRADELDATCRYVRVRASNLGVIPDWHEAKGRKAWLFAGEILFNPQEPD